MKLKLLVFVVVVALLSLVAYQKYTEYSLLRSIDSYESCATAKGSVIQESYPATCVTRLGSHFTKPLTLAQQLSAISPDSTSSWKTYRDSFYKFSLKYPSGMNVKADSNNEYLSYYYSESNNPVFSFYVRENTVSEEVTLIRAQVGGHIITTLAKNENFQFNGISAWILAWKSLDHAILDVVIPSGKNVIVITAQEDLALQILSTFKFTN